MRIGFMGKGGSGKTTISAGFAAWAAKKLAKEILIFDGDVNAHLKEALGIDGEIVPIGHHGEEIAAYLKGERRDLGDAPLLSTTPPAQDSKFIQATAQDPLLSKYALKRNNLSLVTVGSFKEADVGANCYHTKLHSLCMILNHLLDGEEDLVIADCTAGTDSLSTALLLAYDLNVFVIEPTLKSVRVYLDYIDTDTQSAHKTYVLGNKIMSDDDEKFLRSHIGAERLIGSIAVSDELRRYEQGDREGFSRFMDSSAETFEKILTTLRATPRDWNSYLFRLREVHEKNCKWWYNDYYGQDLHEQFDKDFRYEAV